MAEKKTKTTSAADYIQPLYINGLNGRLLGLPSPKNTDREILFVYGHHSTLERWWGVVQDLSQYGNVTMPDLPGFGGMDSFYKIGKKPTIDNLADYLAALIKLRYKNKRFSVAGLSFGFVIVTRMLQRYPEISKKIDLLISVVGFERYDEFKYSKLRYYSYLIGAKFFALAPASMFFKNIMLNPGLLRAVYPKTHNAKEKFAGLNRNDQKLLMNFEVYLWHSNDVRTHMFTTAELLRLDNCQQRVDLPVWHVYVKNDRYFDTQVIEQHMKIIFNQYHGLQSKMSSHAPTLIADKKTARPLIPYRLRQALAKR